MGIQQNAFNTATHYINTKFYKSCQIRSNHFNYSISQIHWIHKKIKAAGCDNDDNLEDKKLIIIEITHYFSQMITGSIVAVN